MIGWCLFALWLVVSLLVIGIGVGIRKDDFVISGIVSSAMLAFVLAICLPLISYTDFITIPEDYITVNKKIKAVTDIITNKEFNLADMEMNKDLSKLIQKREDILRTVRENNRSPLALFKIRLPK